MQKKLLVTLFIVMLSANFSIAEELRQSTFTFLPQTIQIGNLSEHSFACFASPVGVRETIDPFSPSNRVSSTCKICQQQTQQIADRLTYRQAYNESIRTGKNILVCRGLSWEENERQKQVADKNGQIFLIVTEQDVRSDNSLFPLGISLYGSPSTVITNQQPMFVPQTQFNYQFAPMMGGFGGGFSNGGFSGGGGGGCSSGG